MQTSPQIRSVSQNAKIGCVSQNHTPAPNLHEQTPKPQGAEASPFPHNSHKQKAKLTKLAPFRKITPASQPNRFCTNKLYRRTRNTAVSDIKFGSTSTFRCPARKIPRSIVQFCFFASASKSCTVRKWMFGESYQSCGNSFVFGARPVHRCASRTRPVPEIRKRHNRPPSHAQHLAQDLQRMPRLLQRLAQDHVIERLVRIIRKPLLDIALIHRNSARNRPLHLRARQSRRRVHPRPCSRPATPAARLRRSPSRARACSARQSRR